MDDLNIPVELIEANDSVHARGDETNSDIKLTR